MALLVDFIERYHSIAKRRSFFAIVFFIVAISFVVISLGFGTYKISMGEAFDALINHLTGNVVNAKDDLYVWDVRLPRAIGAAFVGAGLAIGGVVMQNLMQNPLAEPYTMGVSSGAFLGAVLSMISGFSIIPALSGDYAVVCNAFVFSLIPVALITVVSRFKKLSPTAIILLGIAVMYVFSSITQYMMVTAESESMASAYHWRVGSLSKVTWDNLPFLVVFVTATSAVLCACYKKLDIMYSGDRCAQTLGINTTFFRMFCLIIVSLMTAAVVSFTGTIGFIGLVGPHIARMFVGSKNKLLLPGAAAFGAAFLIIADTVAKVSGINGLPVGVISSMVGGPLFLYILIKKNKKVWN
ncbi:MAG: iron ABC transporter permease [Candidatus Methanomethylophilaceae archaeon]|nr:iron ABC transporter permease [Candidatus Methanomethylophilaceae archaeon]